MPVNKIVRTITEEEFQMIAERLAARRLKDYEMAFCRKACDQALPKTLEVYVKAVLSPEIQAALTRGARL